MRQPRRHTLLPVVVITTLVALSTTLVAANALADGEEDDRVHYAVQNCASIKISLTQLQRSDSDMRAYLGNIFETTANNFIIPLNLRLVRNNINQPDLISEQSDYVAAKAQFSSAYIRYARSLEDLIKLNCRTNPDRFLTQLDKTRENRAAVREQVERLQDMIRSHTERVESLKGEL